jgi:hypothetical protein
MIANAGKAPRKDLIIQIPPLTMRKFFFPDPEPCKSINANS